jgi:hypothetical protein
VIEKINGSETAADGSDHHRSDDITMTPLRYRCIQYFSVALLATLFSLALYHAWELEPRWFAVVVVAIAMVSISMCFATIFSDFLLCAFFFSLPFSSFVKWFWPDYSSVERGFLVYEGVIGLGVMDFILAGLYISWFYRIVIERTASLPKIEGIDVLIVCLWGCHLVSSVGANDPALGLYAAQYFGKFALLYFYISRHLRPAHLPWLTAALCVSICVQAGLGTYQYSTGKLVGIALDKGAGESELNFQYVVPGLETKNRATGTTYDSHALGDLVAMMFWFPLILFLKPDNWKRFRLLFAGTTVLGVMTVIISFSRSAWLASAITLLIGMPLILVAWREVAVARMLMILGFFGGVAIVLGSGFLYERFERSPIETLTERFGQYRLALEILGMYPIFGVGAGNYMLALREHDFMWLDELPVHNVALWIATETGLLGLFCYVGIIIAALRRLIRVFFARRDLVAVLAMATFLAIITHVFNGLTDPTFREPSVWTMFWITVALARALTNIHRAEAFSFLPASGVHADRSK